MKNDAEQLPAEAERRPYVLFTLAGGTYALRSDTILHLAMAGEVTPVPNAAAYVVGIASIRGRVTPVVDLRALFGFDPVPPDGRTRLIVVSAGGREVALRVDSAREFAMLSDQVVQPLLGTAHDLGGEFVKGMAQVDERLIMVLDVESMVSDRTIRHKLSAGGTPGDNADGTLVEIHER